MANMWDQRFAQEGYAYGDQPNDFLRAEAGHFPPGGRLLCIGEGEGRNAVWLAQQGFRVTAMDGSAVGLAKARKLAAERGVHIDTVHADLESFDLGEGAWDGVVAIWCHLPKALRAKVNAGVVRALKGGGVFLLEAYTPRQLQHRTGGPQTEEMLYEPAELAVELAGLTLLRNAEVEREIHEGELHKGTSATVQLLARKAG